MNKIAVLTVCTANICRSPMAEAILNNKLNSFGLSSHFKVDSAGTHVTSKGIPIDPRALKTLRENTVKGTSSSSRQVTEDDFRYFDYILAMDDRNYKYLTDLCPEEYRGKIVMLMDFSGSENLREVPDPYFGNLSGFSRVYGMLDRGIESFLKKIIETHKL
ncbi:MAG: low molecular weight protein-tyrosine-phosphatase [Sedimenticola sp.]